MCRPFFTLIAVLWWYALRAGVCDAAPIIYSFEAPEFTVGQTTPLLNKPPDAAGPATFTTSFTDAINPGAYMIGVGTSLNSLMMGQALTQNGGIGALTLTFNTPVTQLSVDFAIGVPNGNPAGFLQLVTPSGTIDQTGSNVGGIFQGGVLSFSAASPFTSATLEGFISGGTSETLLAIDNLNLTPAVSGVAEPSTLSLLGFGTAALLGWRRKRKASAA